MATILDALIAIYCIGLIFLIFILNIRHEFYKNPEDKRCRFKTTKGKWQEGIVIEYLKHMDVLIIRTNAGQRILLHINKVKPVYLY